MRDFRSKRVAISIAALVAVAAWATAENQARPLRIGSSGGMGPSETGAKEKAGMETLRSFIKEETGLENEITRESDWRELVANMNDGKVQLGVFPGHEFAWAVEENSKIKPLAIAVNVHRYPVAFAVARKDSNVKDLRGLQGKTVALPKTSPPFVRLYLDREAQAAGSKADQFYGAVSTVDEAETALDDVVDGKAQAGVMERAALEAYKRRKPGRFAQLKEIGHSRPFPPTVIAYVDGNLDGATLERFRKGLIGANRKERGQALLTLFRLTGFETVPEDFSRVLAETGKAYLQDEKAR